MQRSTFGLVAATAVIGSLACAPAARRDDATAPITRAAAPPAGPVASAAPLVVEEHRILYLYAPDGQRIGYVSETLTANADGIEFNRTETVRFLRDGVAHETLAQSRLTGDGAGRPLTSRFITPSRTTLATRDDAGWRIILHSGGSSWRGRAPAAAIPRGWLPVLARMPGAAMPAQMTLMLEDRQAALARATVRRTADGMRLDVATGAGPLFEEWQLDAEGRIVSATDGLFRAVAVAPGAPFTDPGRATWNLPMTRRTRLRAAPLPLAAPTDADLAATFFEPDDETIRFLAAAHPAGQPAISRARALAAHVDSLLDEGKETRWPTMDAGPLTANEALAVRGGDCTAHAALLGALLKVSGIPSRMVTGHRIDEDGVRHAHRWNVAWVDGRWLPLDATDGDAPVGPDHEPFAVHGSTPEELLIDDVLLRAGRSARR